MSETSFEYKILPFINIYKYIYIFFRILFVLKILFLISIFNSAHAQQSPYRETRVGFWPCQEKIIQAVEVRGRIFMLAQQQRFTMLGDRLLRGDAAYNIQQKSTTYLKRQIKGAERAYDRNPYQPGLQNCIEKMERTVNKLVTFEEALKAALEGDFLQLDQIDLDEFFYTVEDPR